jgi:hypothetical protein
MAGEDIAARFRAGEVSLSSTLSRLVAIDEPARAATPDIVKRSNPLSPISANFQLAVAGPADQISDPAAVRAAFEGPWVRWNLLRTGLTLGSLTALSIALLATTSQKPDAL